VFQGFPKGHQGCWGNLVAIRDVSAVSAAAMLMKRKVFEEIGGFDENIKVSFNDIDLCLKVRSKNYSIVITSYAHLYHKESATRGYEYKGEELKNFQREIEYFGKKWKSFLQNGDPFYNKNLSLEHSDYRLDI
jgi:GT2 family glycosyltransferase